MPQGFAMPSQEQLWLPLRRRAIDYVDGLGPAVWVYGRLEEGTSRGEARAELAAIGIRHDAQDDRGLVRADAVAFSALTIGTPTGMLAAFLFIAQGVRLVLLLIACGNVAILLLARTANRSSELALRTALGASRSRIVAQLFVETLVLALLATGVGAQDPPGGGAAGRRVVGGVGLKRFRARARGPSTCALVALRADVHARSAP